MNQTKNLEYSDWLGVAASGLCAIHCALTPLLFAAKPILEGTMGEHVHGHFLWAAMDYIFLVLSFLAVWYSARHTTHATLKWVLWAAWAAFALGLLSESLELPLGSWFMYAGSITLVIAHIKNYHHCQQHKTGG
ncbi:MAG: MerC domain-containing protein [Bacteroidota bacterium]